MLLPSALTCDSQVTTPKTRYQSQLFASPPLSPPPSFSSSTRPAITNLYSTCRALQSMLTIPNQLPSPPTTHAETPFKLRLRTRKGDDTSPSTPRKKISKRVAPPPRGVNKRRRALDDECGRDTEENDEEQSSEDEREDIEMAPSTPKRLRLAPEVIPLGLERSDFHDLQLHSLETQTQPQSHGESGLESGFNPEEWSTEEDRLLVELVLEKLKLTKSDWQDCARSLGKDRGSVGRRWKSLMGGGEVGLKSRGLRRGRIHGTWR